jgi:hypothetical protein
VFWLLALFFGLDFGLGFGSGIGSTTVVSGCSFNNKARLTCASTSTKALSCCGRGVGFGLVFGLDFGLGFWFGDWLHNCCFGLFL